MASDAGAQVEDELQSVIHHLYALMVQVADFPSRETSNTMRNELASLIRTLLGFSTASKNLTLDVPEDVIAYVETGRNPDIYNREFVEAAQSSNQRLKGRSTAFAQFRDVLAQEMRGGMPEIASHVDEVVRNTGGQPTGT